MNLLHLEYFYTVAKEGGFTKASKVLRIGQPAISRMVQMLEEDFEFPLFEKIGRNVQLTPQGLEVFENCKKIFGEVESLKTSLGKISGECKGPLTMGAAEVISSHLLPEILLQLNKKYPLIHPAIYSGPASMLLDKIENGDIELGLFFHVPDISEKLVVEESYLVPFHLVVHKDYKNKKETLESFIGSREIDDNKTRKFPTLDKLKMKYPKAKIKFSSNNLTSHKELVCRGLGVAILPEFLISNELKKEVFVNVLPREIFKFQLKIIRRRNAVLSINAVNMLDLLQLGLQQQDARFQNRH